MKAILLSIVLLFPVTASLAQSQLPPTFLTLPQSSVATTDDALALLVNPAGLGVSDGNGFYFLAPYISDGHFEDWGFVAGDNFGFAAEALRTDPTGVRRRYTWGLGFGDHGTYWGFNYSWTTGIDRQNTWDIGILERPFRFLSVGAVARGVNSPRLYGKRLPIGWDLGLGFRPLGMFKQEWAKPSDRLTLTLDASLRRFDDRPGQTHQKLFEYIDYRYGIQAEPIPGITLHVDYSPDLKGVRQHDAIISGGFTLNFGDIDLGAFQRSGNGRGVAYIGAREEDKETVFR
jgi:hypothetical protein